MPGPPWGSVLACSPRATSWLRSNGLWPPRAGSPRRANPDGGARRRCGERRPMGDAEAGRLLVRGGTLVTPAGARQADVRCRAGRIAEVGGGLEARGERVLDAEIGRASCRERGWRAGVDGAVEST